MQKATTEYKKKTQPQHTIKPNTSPPARAQSTVSQTLRWMKGFLTQTEWHISTRRFLFHTLRFHKQCDFLSELFCALAYLFP